jgi:hypothetical protein
VRSTRRQKGTRNLSARDKLRSSLENDGKQSNRGVWHSKTYHRFFKGYSEISVPRSNGKGYKIQRTYTGDYYRQDLTKGKRILLRGVYVALFLSIAFLFVSTAILPLASNSTWYVVLMQVVSIPFLFWILIAFFSYLPAGRDMTIHTYRSASPALQKATLYSAISLGALAVATLVFMFLNPQAKSLAQLLSVGKYIAVGLIALAMNQIEKKVTYLIIPSQNKPPMK